MSVESQLVTALATAGYGVHPHPADEKATYPFVTYSLDAADYMETAAGWDTGRLNTYSVIVWGRSFTEVKSVGTQILAALSSLSVHVVTESISQDLDTTATGDAIWRRDFSILTAMSEL